MSGDEENELDERLRRHLADALDPLCGRTIRAVQADVAARHRRRRMLIGASSLIAASIVLAVMIPALRRPPHRTGMPRSALVERNTRNTPAVSAPRDLVELVAWEASDEGVET